MANNYGITPAFANLLLGTLNNVPVTVPIVCAKLHDGDPGPTGTANPSAVTARQQLTLETPTNGATALAGAGPSWTMSTGETIEAVSLWSGFDGDPNAIPLFTLPATPPVTVAEGDVLILNVTNLAWTGMAA
ncbi:phage tail fiber protein [Mycobacterium avium]|uniref:phage tail fiber protein n=1 Tax=Mycobacterium avium TaxID=1764 RepID=UPI000BB04ADF|nr:hypothetical protein [Mycobacterium avium]PBA43510.1 hypothetical protein CKJ63_03355 [Mycobacterium avium]PBA85399.1 hypothetical protein CKJ72_03740 [Mycobacterium avium]